MRILFALNQNYEKTIEEDVLKYYNSIIGATFDYVKEYDLVGVSKRLKLEKFDLLILNEELERDNFVSTSFLDDITDKFSDFRVILIVNSEHEQDNYIKRLFNLGIYDLLYSEDISLENIVSLVIRGRTKAEAKIYLDLHDIEDVSVEKELNYIIGAELLRILDYFNSIEKEYIEQAFEHIFKQYNEKQILYLLKHLSGNIIALLENNELYKKIISKQQQANEINMKGEDGGVYDSRSEEKIITKVEKISVLPIDYKKIFAFISPESTGKTEIATNVAMALSKLTDKKIALIDLDFIKYGTLYNFVVDPGEDDINYYKYRLLLTKSFEHLNGESEELSEDKLKELAVYKNKNFMLFAGKQEVNIFDNSKLTSITLGLENLREIILYIIRKILTISDIVILDVGRNLETSIISDISSLMNVEKFLVASQNIEILNSLCYRLNFRNNSDYKDWNLIVNEHRTINGFKDKEIMSYFNDKNVDYLRFNIKNVFYVPYVAELWEHKTNRSAIYSKNEMFSEAIDNIINTCYPIKSKKTTKKFGLFKFRKDGKRQ